MTSALFHQLRRLDFPSRSAMIASSTLQSSGHPPVLMEISLQTCTSARVMELSVNRRGAEDPTSSAASHRSRATFIEARQSRRTEGLGPEQEQKTSKADWDISSVSQIGCCHENGKRRPPGRGRGGAV